MFWLSKASLASLAIKQDLYVAVHLQALVLSFVSVKPVVNKIRKNRLNRDDFETVRIIGRGAFGEVRIVLEKEYQITSCFKYYRYIKTAKYSRSTSLIVVLRHCRIQ